MPKPSWIPSEFQTAIFADVASNREGHLIVEARAGVGKSTTLIESVKHVPHDKKVIALAFNKIIAKELKARAPSYLTTATFHSWGLKAIRQRHKNVEVDNNKTFNIVQSLVEDDTDYDLVSNICDTVSFCKYTLQDTPRQIEELIRRFGIDLCELDMKDFVSIVIKTLGLCKTNLDTVDFDDMCSLPFSLNLPFEGFDVVMVDEYQDLNRSNMVMAKRTLKPGGRLVFFGDDFQGLYSWRAADTSIITDIRNQPTTKTLPLPISYRCPKTVIDLAQRWVPDITCPDDAIDGEINNIDFDTMFEKATPGCFVLSRTNAPLIKVAMRFIREGKGCNIRGRDIGKSLSYLIKKSKKRRMDAFLTWLDKWRDDECKMLAAKNISTDNVMDKHECLLSLCEEHKTLEEVLDRIDAMFTEKEDQKLITCSTVHRAKGLQSDDVFILRPTFRVWLDEGISLLEKPNESANIAYVAATRTIKRLFIVSKF
jgi:superfamily I DNA/RNA helicase